MRFVLRVLSARSVVLLITQAMLGLPAAAQQEVAPDHFDQKPATSQSHKPASQARQSASQTKLKGVKNRSAAKAKDASAATPVLKASAAKNPSATQPR